MENYAYSAGIDMTQDEIIEMARQAGGEFYVTSGNQTPTWYFPHSTIYDFADLVAAKEQKKWQDQTIVEIHEAILEEREACALICDDHHDIWRFGEGEYSASGPKDCAAAIRARTGEQA